MAKILLHNTYGYYWLPKEIVMRYLELVGLSYIFDPDGGWSNEKKWTVNGKPFDPDDEIERHDPLLVQAVEEFEDSFGSHLNIEEVPAGTHYMIEDYDGKEMVRIRENINWRIAE
jgi:hypothetical protein